MGQGAAMFAQHPWLVIEWRLGQGDSSRWTEQRHPRAVSGPVLACAATDNWKLTPSRLLSNT